jgi:hypothetical protein
LIFAKLTGVFVGEYRTDDGLYSVLYDEDGNEYLARCGPNGAWDIVSWKDPDGVETRLDDPVQAPNPISVAYGLITDKLIGNDDQIVI